MLPLNSTAILQALRAWFQPGDVFEVRVLDAQLRQWASRPQTVSGYFDYDHIEDVPRALASLHAYRGVYVTVNPLLPAVLGRSANRLKSDRLIGAKDDEVLSRRWLLVDCDARRVSGVSSSEEEHAYALAKAQEIKRALSGIGWPDPIELDSGNGAQLMYLVDLPADDGGLIKRCLEQLKAASDEHVDIDQTVFNAARIWRLPGCWNCKGDELPEQGRVHRQSAILAIPERLEAVTLEQLRAFAPEAPQQPPPTSAPAVSSSVGSFDFDGFMARHFPGATPVPYQGGEKYVLDVCPFSADHNNKSAIITRSADGRLGFKCHHNGCAGKTWHDLRALLEPKPERVPEGPPVDLSGLVAKVKAGPVVADEAEPEAPVAPRNPLDGPLPADMLADMAETPADVLSLLNRAPDYAPAIVEGLFREREVINVVAAPKTGKSWLVLQLALCVATGRDWLGFKVPNPGPVYVIDNELHETAFAQRLAASMRSNAVSERDVKDRLFCRCLRQYMPTLDRMLPFLDEARTLGAKLIIIDAMYRALPRGFDENSNSDMRDFYNMLNRAADYTGAAIILVHHTSKGIQAGKAVTDLGAGAGAISRAADTHIALRQHLRQGVVVFDAVTRTFPQASRFCIQAIPPMLVRDDSEDPRLLDGMTPAEIRHIQGADMAADLLANKSENDEASKTVSVPFDDVAELLFDGPQQKTAIIERLMALGVTRRDARQVIEQGILDGFLAVENKAQEGARGYTKIISLTKFFHEKK